MYSIKIIFLKELKDMLRDRRTVLAMIILPLILMPTVLGLVAKFTAPKSMSDKSKNIRVAIHTNDNGAELIEQLERRKDIKVFKDISPYEFKGLVKDDSLDFGLILDKDFDAQIADGKTGELELFHKLSRRDTVYFERFVKTIRRYEKDLLSARLKALGSSSSILNPIDIDASNVDPDTGSIGEITGGILPFFFALFCFMGAMYPAIDLFTGEKERGTIETLLVLPTSRIQILLGKLLVVVTTGVISGLLTFFSVFLTLKFSSNMSFIAAALDVQSIVMVVLMMIPLTIFFAGIQIPISIYAKSFKEAQSMIQPLTILITVPLVIGMTSLLKLNITTALIPVLNVALASKQIVGGNIDYGLLGLVYLSLIIFAILGVYLSQKWFGDERNIFRN